jgi:hypothetical protein
MPNGHSHTMGSVDYTWLNSIIASLYGKQPSKWAVICVCFQDDPATLPDLKHYRDLFTRAGAGTLNMVDCFEDMSHGKIDVGDSQVFGWYRLAHDRALYVGNTYPQPAGKYNRDGLLQLARDAATAAGVNLAAFDGVVVSAFGSTDLCGWIGGMAALCDQNSLQPSLLGQEMGHGYGLDHARVDGSTADYADPWDVMSTAVWPTMAPNAAYTLVGPGLNAWNMRSRGWLNEQRVWSGDSKGYENVAITLRPLHDRRLAGYLAAEVGPYLVEFRVRTRWDAAIPRSAVLVHRFEDNRSYLMPAVGGGQDLVKGDRFEHGSEGFVAADYYRVSVLAIDETGGNATILVTYRPHQIPHVDQPIPRFFYVDERAGLWIKGSFFPVPPRGPVFELTRALGRYLQTDVEGAVAAGIEMRRQHLQQVVRQALTLYAQLEDVSGTPPGVDLRGEHEH